MRLIFIFPILLASTGCVPSAPKESSATPAAAKRDAPFLWSDYASPKILQVSADFSNDELANITAMSTAWKTGLQDKKTFFDYGARTPEITNSLSNLDTMLDSTLGIYKTLQWPPELPDSALAVTQIFGRRHNAGTATEYVDIEHADILVNYDKHRFDTADTGNNYDLRTVILHELGHFMGLQHKSTSTSRNSSVMYPSISTSENKREPKAIDIADLAAKYSVTLDGGSGSGTSQMVKEQDDIKYVPNNPQEAGEAVKVIMELHANGECVHKINGATSGRHQLNLNQR